MKTRIYISGGITNVKDYMEKFKEAEDHLNELGYSVINPAKVLGNMPEDTEWVEYMELCVVMINQAQVIYMLPEWQQSKGARIERQTAIELGKDVIYA